MKKALVLGAEGQDGQLLTDFLRRKKYLILGVGKNISLSTDKRHWPAMDVSNFQSVSNVIKSFSPDEIYYLAAYHYPSQNKELHSSADLWANSFSTHVLGLTNVLESIRLYNQAIKLFYASSCLIFGNTAVSPQTEDTPFVPNEIYALTKATGMQVCQYYREQYCLFAASGILYNHESILRAKNFVSQKIIQGALSIKNGKADYLDLGNVSTEIDWGYAPNFVAAMYQILQLDHAEDFIIATGKSHTVLDFVVQAFSYLGLDWSKHVRVNNSIIQRQRGKLVGDFSKLRSKTGWKPTVSFNQMIVNMINGDI